MTQYDIGPLLIIQQVYHGCLGLCCMTHGLICTEIELVTPHEVGYIQLQILLCTATSVLEQCSLSFSAVRL